MLSVRKFILLLVTIAASGLFSACRPALAQPLPEEIASRKINIVATIGMITDIVKNIGGERVNVTGLMGPGVDPHLYKASAGDVRALANADIVFYNGLHLEAGMGKVLERMETTHILTVAVTNQIPR